MKLSNNLSKSKFSLLATSLGIAIFSYTSLVFSAPASSIPPSPSKPKTVTLQVTRYINFDDVPTYTAIKNQYISKGVTFELTDNSPLSRWYNNFNAYDSAYAVNPQSYGFSAQSQPNVITSSSLGDPGVMGGDILITFIQPSSTFSIDVACSVPYNTNTFASPCEPAVDIWDVNGNRIGHLLWNGINKPMSGQVGSTTLSFNTSTQSIKKVIVRSSAATIGNGNSIGEVIPRIYFDNLIFNALVTYKY
jgi:hypothetical protein